MFSFLNSKEGIPVPESEIQVRYNRLRWHALFGIFIGYVAYYILRNNFLLSSPELISDFGFTKKDIGFISGTMLIVYGISKGVMSALADKSNPKHFMLFGLVMSAIVNLLMGFTASFWIFLLLCVMNGIFQGMGAGPAYVVLASWFPRKSRGVTTAIFNISHNVGGGLVAPIAGASIAWLGQEHWQSAHFIVPAVLACMIAIVFYISPLIVVMNKAKFDGLDLAFQKAMVEAAQEAGKYQRQLNMENEKGILEKLEKAGIQIVEKVDNTPFKAIIEKEVRKAFIEKNGDDLVKQIDALAK